MTASADPTLETARRHRPRRVDALDGLRTLAVFLVVGYHLSVPGFTGGFLGVDVFFVLSGFLITTLLLREVDRRGRVDLGRFWRGRILRLMPAALAVILAVVLWAVVVAPPFRRPGIGADALWSLLYVGNWRFISTSSYFDDDGTQSPLLHVWSLAVEEQFYLLWPLVFVGVAALVLRGLRGSAGRTLDSAERSERALLRRRRTAFAVAGTSGVLALVSAVLLSVHYDPAAPDRAYMGTDTKAVEPLLGALTAAVLVFPRPRALVTRYAQPLMVVGLLGVVVGFLTLGDQAAPAPAYFHGGAVAFSIGCAVLVAATSLADRRYGLTPVLGSTPLAYLGRISYGIYLWHWPLAVWIVQGHGFSPRRAALALLLTLAFAALSYHLLEMPLRTGRLSRASFAPVAARAAGAIAVVALAAATLGGTPVNRVLPAVAAGDSDASTIVVVGDSVAQRLMPGLAATAEERGVTVLSAARGGCPALGVDVFDGRGGLVGDGVCADRIPARQAETIATARPATVLWWSRYELADRVGPDGTRLVAGTPDFWAAQRVDLDRSVDRLTATGAALVIVETDRSGRGIDSRCTPDRCDPFLDRLRNHDGLRQEWNRVLASYVASDPRVRLIRMEDLYCRDAVNPCDDAKPVRASAGEPFAPPSGTGLARPDGSHFDEASMPTVSAALLDRLASATGQGVPGDGDPTR